MSLYSFGEYLSLI